MYSIDHSIGVHPSPYLIWSMYADRWILIDVHRPMCINQCTLIAVQRLMYWSNIILINSLFNHCTNTIHWSRYFGFPSKAFTVSRYRAASSSLHAKIREKLFCSTNHSGTVTERCCHRCRHDKAAAGIQSPISIQLSVYGRNLDVNCGIVMRGRGRIEWLQICSQEPLSSIWMAHCGCGRGWDCRVGAWRRAACEVAALCDDLAGW